MSLQFDIPYPIPATFERQLMDALPSKLKSERSHFLKHSLKDFRYTGKIPARMRREKKTELRKPIKKTWGGFWGDFYGGFETNSNFILEMTLFAGPIQPAHARALCYIFGLLPEDVGVDILGRPSELVGQLKLPSAESEAVVRFFRLLADSAAGGGEIQIGGAP